MHNILKIEFNNNNNVKINGNPYSELDKTLKQIIDELNIDTEENRSELKLIRYDVNTIEDDYLDTAPFFNVNGLIVFNKKLSDLDYTIKDLIVSFKEGIYTISVYNGGLGAGPEDIDIAQFVTGMIDFFNSEMGNIPSYIIGEIVINVIKSFFKKAKSIFNIKPKDVINGIFTKDKISKTELKRLFHDSTDEEIVMVLNFLGYKTDDGQIFIKDKKSTDLVETYLKENKSKTYNAVNKDN